MKRSNPTENTPESDAGHQKPASGSPRTTVPPRGEIFDFDLSSSNPMSNLSSPKLWPKSWFLLGFAAVFCIFSLGYFVRSKSKVPEPIGPFVDPTNASPTLKVQVLGQVKNPGVYDLAGGARIQDALNAAGGALPDADLRSLNLADWAKDGSKIEVPTLAVTAPVVPVQSGPLPAASPVVGSTPLAAPALPDAGIPKATRPAGGESVNADVEYLKQNPLDLNTASAAQLEVLPGVGPKMAAKIVEYRVQIGRFNSVNELDNVPGIGEKKLAMIRQLVAVK